jgi:predicted Zn-dependent protease
MLELAEYDFTEAIKRDPTNTDYILCRADTRIKLKRYKEAREDLDKLVALGISRAGLAEFYKQAK